MTLEAYSVVRRYLEALAQCPAAAAPRLVLDELYHHQRVVLLSAAKRVSICTPRQVGKTYLVSRALFHSALTNDNPKGFIIYLTDTRIHAKDLVWNELIGLCERYKVRIKTNLSELTFTFEYNGAIIKLVGADDEREAAKMRGYQFRHFIIDEAQSLRDSFLNPLINEHIAAGLDAFRAPLWLVGTPGPVRDGVFFQATEKASDNGWETHTWNQYQNPLFPRWAGMDQWESEVKAFLEEKAKAYPKGVEDPAFLREYMGVWAVDEDKYCYHLSEEKNLLVGQPPEDDIKTILGIDLGYEDKTAFVVMGYSRKSGIVYALAFETEGKPLIHDVVYRARYLTEKYRPARIRIDSAGAGKIIVKTLEEEIRCRFGIPVQAAEKQSKAAYMRIFDSDICQGKVKIPHGELWSQMQHLVKEPRKGIEAEGQAADLADAALYAFRDCRHFIADALPPPARLPQHEQAYMDAIKQSYVAEEEESLEEYL